MYAFLLISEPFKDNKLSTAMNNALDNIRGMHKRFSDSYVILTGGNLEYKNNHKLLTRAEGLKKLLKIPEDKIILEQSSLELFGQLAYSSKLIPTKLVCVLCNQHYSRFISDVANNLLISHDIKLKPIEGDKIGFFDPLNKELKQAKKIFNNYNGTAYGFIKYLEQNHPSYK